MMGTLRVLLDAKRIRLISDVEPMLDRLESLRFRLSGKTRSAVLKMAGES
jgi:predicted nucleic acid-binding protein